MVSVCTVPARGGRSCEHFGGYKTINLIPFTFTFTMYFVDSHSWMWSTNVTITITSGMFSLICHAFYQIPCVTFHLHALASG